MIKIFILFFVAVWAVSFLFGSRRRLIRDTNHLLVLIIWVVLLFFGLSYFSKIERLESNVLIYIVASIVWGVLTYKASQLMVRLWIKTAHCGFFHWGAVSWLWGWVGHGHLNRSGVPCSPARKNSSDWRTS